MPSEAPGQAVLDQRRQSILQRARDLVAAMPEDSRRQSYRTNMVSPHFRYAWEARDLLEELIALFEFMFEKGFK